MSRDDNFDRKEVLMNFYAVMRLGFIEETLEKKGYIRRADIINKFGVGESTATRDLAQFRKENPDFSQYNVTNKRYEKVENDE